MCNAWNHSWACNCGWGGRGRRGKKGSKWSKYKNCSSATAYTTSVLNKQVTKNYYSLFPKALEEATTYPTKCWWCGEYVYYHTNGYGDSVLFDGLGYPWQVHNCWTDYWKGEKVARGRAPARQPGLPVILRKLLKDRDLKCLMLVGAISCMAQKGIPLAEASLAEYLGISLDILQKHYSNLYELYRRDKKIYLRLSDSVPLGSRLKNKLAW